MLSIGSAAYLPDKTLHGGFTVNLETLPGAVQNPDTMKWWKTQPEAWAACRQDVQSPETAMRNYLEWLKQLPGEPVFVAYPAAFDFMFVCWYLNRFAGENPFGWHALDIKTFAMALTGRDFLDTVKRNMPRNWFDDLPYTHKALDDAVSQGALFCNMLAEHKRRLKAGGRSERPRAGEFGGGTSKSAFTVAPRVSIFSATRKRRRCNVKALLFVTLLLTPVSPFQGGEASPLTVVSAKWTKTRQRGKNPAPLGSPPAAAIPAADKNFARNRRINAPAGVRDPNADTLD